jgi:hypothetical protein
MSHTKYQRWPEEAIAELAAIVAQGLRIRRGSLKQLAERHGIPHRSVITRACELRKAAEGSQ